MAKSRSQATRRASPSASKAQRTVLKPDWMTFGLALSGVLLALYLLLSQGLGAAPLFCSEGSGCDRVWHSPQARLLGLPVTLFGLALYAGLAIAAVAPASRLKRWRRLWALAWLGLAVSLYLNLASAARVGAWCGWCLASAVLMLVLFLRAHLSRPDSAPGIPWRSWWLNQGALALGLVALVWLAQSGLLPPRHDPRLEALALHLRETGARYYGASWCTACIEQARRFGSAAAQLPYIECAPQGRNGPIAPACVAAGVETFPTWVIRGQTHNGLIEPRELARLSRFRWDDTAAN